MRFSGVGAVTNILLYPWAIAPAIAKPNDADLPLPLAAVNATVDLNVFSAIASMNKSNAFAWSTVFVKFTNTSKCSDPLSVCLSCSNSSCCGVLDVGSNWRGEMWVIDLESGKMVNSSYN